MNMKRKGETFTEFLVATTVFGMIMAGIFEFMANQTENLARIRDMDDLMYYAQRFEAISGDKTLQNNYTCTEGNIKYKLTDNNKNLIVTKNDNTSLTFTFKP